MKWITRKRVKRSTALPTFIHRKGLNEAPVAGFCRRSDLFLFHPGMGRHSHLPGSPTLTGSSRRHGRQGGYSERRHREGAERLAGDGRHGGRLDLGPRQLRRTGLVGGLAAPGVRLHPQRVGEHGLPKRFRQDRAGAAGRTPEAARTPDANEHVRPRHPDGHGGPRAGEGVRGEPAALRRRVHQRQGRLRHPQGGAGRPRKTPPVGCLLLLDLVGGVHQPSRSRPFVHKQLAARAAGQQPAHLERPWSGPA